MKLTHYSSKPVTSVYSSEQKCYEEDMKPRGFWLSCDDYKQNWREWCESEQFGIRGLTHVHRVTLAKGAKILRLRNAADIDAFDREYRGRGNRWSMRCIRWGNVANNYQGIIIAPYVWERRLADHAQWYYGWDCASGCVWDANAIKGIKLVNVFSSPAIKSDNDALRVNT